MRTLPSTAEPLEIMGEYDKHVIGQQGAKINLATTIYNHFRRQMGHVKDRGVKIQKQNMLFIGPTGSGKTRLVELTAELFSVPFYAADATAVTDAGYVGLDVETILWGLLQKAGGNVGHAENGIVLIDEVDKIARSTGSSKDIGTEGVQQAMLKMLEGKEALVPENGNGRGNARMIPMQTDNILFILAGAFPGLEKIIQKRVNTAGTFGFLGEHLTEEQQFALLRKVHPDDLVKYGLIREFIGRIPILSVLQKLTVGELVKILTEPEDSLIAQYNALLYGKVEFCFEQDALETIAQLAYDTGTGARALSTIVSEVVRPYNFRLEPRFVRITKDDVLNRERVDPLDGFGATTALASAPPAMQRQGGRRDQSDGSKAGGGRRRRA